MSKFKGKDSEVQPLDWWVPTQQIVGGSRNTFYDHLKLVLRQMDFTQAVRDICTPFYHHGTVRGGRTPVAPAVRFKRLMVGFLEGIPSERGIADRCADSLTLAAFQAVHRVVLAALRNTILQIPQNNAAGTVVPQAVKLHAL